MEENASGQKHSELFPQEIIEQTTQHHFWQHSIRSQVLYSSVLCSLVAALAVLPFLYVDVSVSGRGIIRPISERKMLTSPVSGKVAEWRLQENDEITKGTVVAEIESPLLVKRMDYNRHRQEEVQRYIQDLSALVKLDSATVGSTKPKLESTVFRRSLTAFRQELKSAAIERQNTRRKYNRRLQLYERQAVSFADLEESQFALNSATNRYQLLFGRQMSEWETELMRYRQELDELEAEALQLLEEQRQYQIQMPVTGTVQNLAGLSAGSYVQINQQLAEISPDTGLVAECYISPGDIGLLKEGMETRFQIDAFDYNRWGTITGKVTEISSDIIMVDNQPLFSVRSVLDQPYLSLPNGYKGYLKKGMTFQARFRITERSLFQLLYDNVDDWLNPLWNDTEHVARAG